MIFKEDRSLMMLEIPVELVDSNVQLLEIPTELLPQFESTSKLNEKVVEMEKI